MSEKIRIKCPTCQVTLQLSSSLRGKQITCPKCKTSLKLPAKPTTVSPTTVSPTTGAPATTGSSAPSKPVATSKPVTHTKPAAPTKPAPQPSSIWDDPNAFSGGVPQSPYANQPVDNSWAQQQPATFTPTTSYTGSSMASYAGAANSSYNAVKKKTVRRSEPELTEQESRLQFSAIFLILVPLITTLLPLFGLQLRRLAGLGNFAPIGGLFLGLIGSGIIVWARRKRSDSYLMGAIGAVCSIVLGVGGYSILEYKDSLDASEATASNSTQSQLAGVVPPSAPNQSQGRLGGTSSTSNSFRGSQADFAELGGTAGSRNGLPPGNPAMAGQTSNQSSGSAAKAPNPRMEDANLFKQAGSVMSDLMSIHSDGSMDSIQIRATGGSLPNVLNLVGSQQFACTLHSRAPARGVCGFSLGSTIHIVPIERTKSEMKSAVVADGIEGLHGLRFAFDANRIVGFQVVTKSPAGGELTESEWFGRKTDKIEESLNPEPGKTGFICFHDGQDFSGFGWVIL